MSTTCRSDDENPNAAIIPITVSTGDALKKKLEVRHSRCFQERKTFQAKGTWRIKCALLL
jgi:hypothetical protein